MFGGANECSVGRAGDRGSASPPHPMYMYKCCGVCSFLWFASQAGREGGGRGGGGVFGVLGCRSFESALRGVGLVVR